MLRSDAYAEENPDVPVWESDEDVSSPTTATSPQNSKRTKKSHGKTPAKCGSRRSSRVKSVREKFTPPRENVSSSAKKRHHSAVPSKRNRSTEKGKKKVTDNEGDNGDGDDGDCDSDVDGVKLDFLNEQLDGVIRSQQRFQEQLSAVVKQLADHSPRTSARRSKGKEASRKNSFPSYAEKDDVSSSNCSPSTHINVESIEDLFDLELENQRLRDQLCALKRRKALQNLLSKKKQRR